MLNVVLQLDLSEDPKSKNLPEMSSVTSHYVENMYHNSFLWQKVSGLWVVPFSDKDEGGHLGF